MQIRREQINAMAQSNRPLLRRDLATHLLQFRPHLFEIHPTPYLMVLIDDTIELALSFGMTDVLATRVFLQLRWDVAPGFYLQPDIAAALHRHGHEGMACWEWLARDEYGDAWLAAHEFDQPRHWRERLWTPPQ